MSTTALDSTYGAWFISLLLETILYGMGILQTWNYFAARATDPRAVQATVAVVFFLETVQVIFFSISSYSRLVTDVGMWIEGRIPYNFLLQHVVHFCSVVNLADLRL
ncbi:hypothetical protein R3P38DRAFT_3202601 [Favolaschia claudopus]|uniref:Uncharacterized protein n=1 Tax=Favolaschia claudopus TaxID=2862362 RepID=A0AAW0AUY3_9AGAR